MSALPIVVLGAGPAGLAAAEAASAGGHPVLIIDENPAPGGQIWRGACDANADRAPGAGDDRGARLCAQLRARPHVSWLAGARAAAPAGPGALLVETAGADAARIVPWEKVIVCSGARELLLPFPGWTLPGVTGAGGLQALLKGGMPVAGKRVVVAGSGPLLLAVAASVRAQGGQVAAIVEQRSSAQLARFAARLAWSQRGKLWQALRLAAGLGGVPYLRGATVSAALGSGRLERVTVSRGGARSAIELACDFLACGFGLVPALETASLFGCAGGQAGVQVDQYQRSSVAGVWAAGELTGIGGVDKSLAEGRIAGLDAVGQAPSASELDARSRAWRFAALLAHSFAPQPALRSLCQDDTIVCRCEDVRVAELAPHGGWRSAKLQTRVGMGPCQGKVCGAACQFLYGWEAPGLRAPVFPLLAGSLAAIGKEQGAPCAPPDTN